MSEQPEHTFAGRPGGKPRRSARDRIGTHMNQTQQKIVQYLEEAQATERSLIRVLQSQIAMTPRGSYRDALETHLRETRDHADRVGRRLQALGHGGNPLMVIVGVAETVAGQALALGKTPLDL